MIDFKLVSKITNIESIAIGNSIRDLARLNRTYGKGRWRKLKGQATVELKDGTVCRVEIHWYSAHGIGNFECKIKYFWD